MNIIVFDIGNTHIVLGLYKEDVLVKSWRLRTDKTKTEDEYYALFRNLFGAIDMQVLDIDKVALSSVVPNLTRVFCHMSEKYFAKEAIVVTAYTDLGLTFPMPDPGFVGSDLVVNGFSAIQKYNENCIICDLGTATTIQLVGKDGYFHGTSIIPGVMTAASRLFESASQLSNIQLKNPENILGLSTQDALNSGIIKGHRFMIEAFIDEIKESYSKMGEIKVIATGGITDLILKQSTKIDIIDKKLLLDGLFLIAKR